MSMLIGKVEPGDVIGRCRIIRELGRGGVGTVYLARHQTLQIEVALKVLSPALSMDNPALAERFIREAQLAARIRHPNVIAVMDAAHDEPTGLYYIVFEYVGGGALSWHLRNGPLPEARALGILCGIAQALVVAEENSIVHRDIKPENIMLDARGTAKLADLGLAKHDIDSRTSLTLGGSYMGTPAYMSPEQARDAKAADTRDDIYSLGATFYECLTGEPPFSGDTPYNIMSELLTKPSPLVSDRRPDVSRSADMICRKMMAKTRGLRYGDALSLVRDLQHCQAHGDAKFDGLEAATFARDSIMARQQALQHGVHPATEEMASNASAPSPPVLHNPRRTPQPVPADDEGSFRAALWLLALVLVAMVLLAVFGHGFSTIDSATSVPVTTVAAKPEKPVASKPGKKRPEHAASFKPKPARPDSEETTLPPDIAPKLTETSIAPPRALPVTLPVMFGTTNTPPLPAPAPGDANMAAIPIAQPANPAGVTNVALGITAPPASPSVTPPQTAFEARATVEASLNSSLIAPTGRASLLKIIGRHDPSSPTPRTWTFYFYDPHAKGNATYITLRDGKMVRDGEALTSTLLPWHEDDVLPEDKLKVDSNAALATAQALIPNVRISSSAFELIQPHNYAPMWKLTLWTLDRDGNEKAIGTVQILTETGYVVKNDLVLPARDH